MFENLQTNIEQLPSVDTVNYIAVEKNYFKIIFLNLAITYGIITLGVFVFQSYTDWGIFNHNYNWIFYASIAMVFIVQLIIYKLDFSKRKYALRDKDILYTSGLITNQLTVLPFNRIQHLEIKRSFLARQLDISTLKIYSAGNSGGDLAIHGLPKELASKINAHLTSIINERI